MQTCPSILSTKQKLLCQLHFLFQEVLLQQMRDQEQLQTDCQQQLADSSLQLREQHLQQSLLSKQSAVIIASLKSKVQASPLIPMKLCFSSATSLSYSIYKPTASILHAVVPVAPYRR